MCLGVEVFDPVFAKSIGTMAGGGNFKGRGRGGGGNQEQWQQSQQMQPQQF
jgi:hypothetical protein